MDDDNEYDDGDYDEQDLNDAGFIDNSQIPPTQPYKSQAETYRVPLIKQSGKSGLVMFDYVVKLKGPDLSRFKNPSLLRQEIIKFKGPNLSIENAFINNVNGLIYIFTNNKETFDILSADWDDSAFEKGIEVIRTKIVKKFFVAILGIDVSVDVRDGPFQDLCKEYRLHDAKRLIKKKENKALLTVKAFLDNEEDFLKIQKTGIKFEFGRFKVIPWVFKEQPLQCYKCQQYGHSQRFCIKEQVCFICANIGHSFKDCPDKKKPPKCVNCKLQHAACRKLCEANTRAVQELEARKKNAYISPNIIPGKKFSDVVNNELLIDNNKLSSHESTIIKAVIGLISLLIPNDQRMQKLTTEINKIYHG